MEPTVDVVGVDVLDSSSADISGLSPECNAPQLVHPTQLNVYRQRNAIASKTSAAITTTSRSCCLSLCVCPHFTAGGIVVQRAGGQSSQVTEVLEEVEPSHADGFRLQLGHLHNYYKTIEKNRKPYCNYNKINICKEKKKKTDLIFFYPFPPSPGRGACRSPCPWHVGLCCAPG